MRTRRELQRAHLVALAVCTLGPHSACAPIDVDFAPQSETPAPESPCTPVTTPRSRIVYLVDRSVSLLQQDPVAFHLAALQRAFDALATRRDADVAVISYGATVQVQPFLAGPAFALSHGLFPSEREGVADLEGGLVATRDLLRDVGGDGAHTQVILVTAGAVGPKCCNAAEEDNTQASGWPAECLVPEWVHTTDIGVPACEGRIEMALCNSAEDLAAARALFAPQPLDGALLLGFTPGSDRNRHYRLGALLREMERTAMDAQGSFRFDVAHIESPNAPQLIEGDPMRIDSCQASAALERLAAEVVTHSVTHMQPAPDMALPTVLPSLCEEDAAAAP